MSNFKKSYLICSLKLLKSVSNTLAKELHPPPFDRQLLSEGVLSGRYIIETVPHHLIALKANIESGKFFDPLLDTVPIQPLPVDLRPIAFDPVRVLKEIKQNKIQAYRLDHNARPHILPPLPLKLYTDHPSAA